MSDVTPEALKELISKLDPAMYDSLLDEVETYQSALVREKAQKNFMEYVKLMWPGFIHGRHHALMAKKFEAIADGTLKRVIINMPPRHAIMTGMKIPTLAGMKTMNDLLVGDFVFGPDGKPVEVLGKSEVFKNRKLYRVTTDDGASLVVDGEHLWTVRLDRKRGNWLDYTTEDLWLRQNGWMVRRMPNGSVQKIKLKDQKEVRLPMLPPVQPVEYEPRLLAIDPYVLGVWLGDGSRSSAIITCHDDDAAYTRAEFEKRGYTTTDQATRFTFGVLNLQVKLKEIGVFKNKHIPRKYLEASAFQRRELLKGLMDTDGNVSKAGQCFFAQSNRDFIEQVAELIRSLGIKASILESEAKIGEKSYGKTWKISFYASDVFTLPRKEDRTLKGERKFGRYIKVEALEESGDTQCIKVNRDDGLFLAGEGYICTHNTKSEFASYLFPSWFLGKFPHKKIIQCSNTGELAVGFGRKVRNLVGSETYSKVFPDVSLRQDSKAAGRWSTNKNGEYFAIGVGGTVTGKGGDIVIIDDPHSEQEAALAAGNPEVYQKVYEWYTSGPRQRLQPGGTIVMVMCMTGDTSVLMADGSKKFLRDLCLGDQVATFDNGKLSTSKVNNWRSSGIDSIYKVQTLSGKILRANERHPFLVINEGVLEWTRLNNLKVGDLLVSLKDANDHQDQKENPEDAIHAKPKTHTIAKTPMRQYNHWGIMGNGKGLRALLKNVKTLLQVVAYAVNTTSNNFHQQNHLQKKTELGVLNTGTGLPLSSMKQWWRNVVTAAMSVASLRQTQTPERIGMESCASTTTMKRERSEDYSAMTAILRSVMEKQQMYLTELHRISDFTADPIVAILPDGEEEVFDVEIDKTENFIANGIVSHNTRWAENDLTGRVLTDAMKRSTGEDWDIIELPAILPSGNPLWPEFWSIKELEALREELPPSKWNAQYQQRPTGEEGALVKREWWKMWEGERAPPCEFIIQSWDTAFTKNERSDYSACTTWGVFYKDENQNDPNIILLDAFQERMEFPELKDKAIEMYREWQPDTCVIEAKAAGSPLIFELQRMGITVYPYNPVRGNDKFVRLNSVTDLFRSGKVWAPDMRWAHEVIEQMASFPNAAHDDLVDSSTQALIRFRQGGFIRLDSDEEDDIKVKRRTYAYY